MKGEELRKYLFRGFQPCSNGNCVISGKTKGVHTNGSCQCLSNFNRAQLGILSSRINAACELK